MLGQGLKDLLYLCLVDFLPGTHLHVLHPEEAAALEEADQHPLAPREPILQPKVGATGKLPHSLLTREAVARSQHKWQSMGLSR